MNIRETLNNLDYYGLKRLWNKHFEWAKTNNRISRQPKWWDEANTLNLIGVRCNSEADFNYKKYNDYLLVIFNREDSFFDYQLIEVTVDPFSNKDRIAHLRQGVWNSYVVRPHRWARRTFSKIGFQWRWACCQDLSKVEIVRTNGKGEIIDTDIGSFGINIHDNGGYTDTSLGCTVIKSDEDYINRFLPYIYDIKNRKEVPANHNNLTYCLINHNQLLSYGLTGEPVLATAENGITVKVEEKPDNA